jgi:hypothetical protein
MPLVDGTDTTPDDAIAARRCPECGEDLTKVHARSHFATHWTGPIENSRRTEEARRRIELCRKYLEQFPDADAKK